MERQEFEATLEADQRGVVRIRIPFDPSVTWGKVRRHYVRGTINDTGFEGSLGSRGGAWYFPVNKALQQKIGAGPGDPVRVAIVPGPAPDAAIPDDLAQALAADPAADAFFRRLSSFYQREYAGWITAAKAAETRQRRVGEVVELLRQGRRQRSAGSPDHPTTRRSRGRAGS